MSEKILTKKKAILEKLGLFVSYAGSSLLYYPKHCYHDKYYFDCYITHPKSKFAIIIDELFEEYDDLLVEEDNLIKMQNEFAKKNNCIIIRHNSRNPDIVVLKIIAQIHQTLMEEKNNEEENSDSDSSSESSSESSDSDSDSDILDEKPKNNYINNSTSSSNVVYRAKPARCSSISSSNFDDESQAKPARGTIKQVDEMEVVNTPVKKSSEERRKMDFQYKMSENYGLELQFKMSKNYELELQYKSSDNFKYKLQNDLRIKELELQIAERKLELAKKN